MRSNQPLSLLIPILALAALIASPGQRLFADAIETGPELDTFFHHFVGLSDEQIRDIRAGKAVAKVLDTSTPEQVFVFGAVYINSTPERYLKMAWDIEALRKLPNYLALNKFSDPPQLTDLTGFTLADEEIKELEHCKAGHCEVQLPTEAMERPLEQSASPMLTSHRTWKSVST